MTNTQTFILLATPGERHEDVIPYGLYTLEGIVKVLLDLHFDNEAAEYYLFFMKPDQKWNGSGDCDLVLSWNEETPKDKVDTYEGEVALDDLPDYLDEFM